MSLKLKKIAVAVIMMLFSSTLLAQDIRVYVNDTEVKMDVAPELKLNTTFVPISFIAKALGAEVKWENPNIMIKREGTEIICTIGSTEVKKDGQSIYLTSAPYITSNRTLVPLRLISEQLGCKVSFDNINKVIYIGEYSEGESAPTISDMNQALLEGFELSPNGLWGIKKEQVYTSSEREDFIYLRDNTTGSIKEIYSTTAFLRVNWLKDNRLLLSGIKDALGGVARKHIMCYDPITDKLTNLADVDGFEYLQSSHSIVYFKRSVADDSDLVGSTCKILDLATDVTTTITQEQYNAYIDKEFGN